MLELLRIVEALKGSPRRVSQGEGRTCFYGLWPRLTMQVEYVYPGKVLELYS